MQNIFYYSFVQDQEQKTGESTPTRLEKQIDKAVGGWKTSSSQFNAVTGKIRTAGKFLEALKAPFCLTHITLTIVQCGSFQKIRNNQFLIFAGWRAYGVPTIRSDLPAPMTRRVADTTVSGSSSMLF